MKFPCSLKAVLLLTVVLSACHTEYVQNKLKIQSFSVTGYDVAENKVHIRFDVSYYFDSTFRNSFSSSIEKGQNGSDEEIIYFGVNKEQNTIPYHCSHPDLDSFKNGFNHNYRPFIGQKLDFEQQLCIAPFHRSEKDTLLMVLCNRKTGTTDTLSALIP
jgi:hypothetical protein